MDEEDIFWDNYFYFAGGPNRTLLNCVPFRRHLNEFFGVGETKVRVDCTHWVFIHEGYTYDSVEDGHQPGGLDMHCTMFSFYYELFFSRYKREFNLKGLRVVRNYLDYIENLIDIYLAIAKAFENEDIIAWVHSYEPWAEHGTYLTDSDYAGKARVNIRILRKLKRSARGRVRELFT